MRTKILLALFMMLVTLSCASPARHPAASSSSSGGSGEAVWQIDDDANIAYPRCPVCGADADRNVSVCAKCGATCRVVPRTIPCPECEGSKHCVHCGKAQACVACAGTKVCAICDGTGKWHGDVCPECEGAKVCPDCAAGHPEAKCDSCSGSGVCANCGGTGTITLK